MFAKRANGVLKGMATEACRTCSSQQGLQPSEFFGVDMVPEPPWFEDGIHGGPVAGWDDGSQTDEGIINRYEEGRSRRGKEGSRGGPQRDVSASLDSIPLTVITDAKDVFDKNNSDTPSFGSQKSLAFSISWLRSTLRRPNTALRWTATENMLTDALTKDMDPSYLHRVLEEGKWCVKYSSAFIKQTAKPLKKDQVIPDAVTVGKPIGDDEQLASRLTKLADSPGWHREGDVVAHVARNARAFRTPRPRYDPKEYDLRSTFGRFDRSDGCIEWRELENLVTYQDGSRLGTGLIGQTANVLITFFQMSSHCNKKDRSAAEDSALHG